MLIIRLINFIDIIFFSCDMFFHHNDWNNGESEITAVVDDACTFGKKKKGTFSNILGHYDVALGKTKVESTVSHEGMPKFYR